MPVADGSPDAARPGGPCPHAGRRRLLVALTLAGALAGQEPTAPTSTPAWRTARWHTRLDTACTAARGPGRLVLAYVRTSDPRDVALSFEARVLAAAGFAATSEDLELLALDATARADADAVARLGLDDLPGVAVVDADGTVQARLAISQATTQADLTQTLVAVQSNRDLAATLQDMPPAEREAHAGDLLAAEAAVGKYDFDQLDKRMQALGEHLTQAQRDRIRPVHVELECAWLLRQRDLTPKQRSAHFWRLLRSGRLPTGRVRTRFWLEYAATGQAVGDPLMIDAALEALGEMRDVDESVRQRLRAAAAELRAR